MATFQTYRYYQLSWDKDPLALRLFVSTFYSPSKTSMVMRICGLGTPRLVRRL